MEITQKDKMKIREAVLVLITLPCFAQQPPTPPSHHAAAPPVATAPSTTQRPPMGPTPQFTQLEQVIAKDISQKQADLQMEINDFLREIRTSHPGYEFMNGNLVPLAQPPTPPKPEEKK